MNNAEFDKENKEPRAIIDGVSVYCRFDEIIDIGEAIENPKNPNQHPEDQIKLLAQIIKAQGWRAPITISTRSGFIVKGHGRLAAGRLLGLSQVPVEFQHYESEAREFADLTADNRLAELAEINNTMLADILSDINTGEIPLELTGYTEDDLEGILNAMTGEDDAEPNDQDNEVEQPCSPMSKRGDLWMLGEHRLICGDSTNEETIARLMDGELASMVHTDPPYGVSFTGGEGKTWDMIKNDAKTGDDLLHTLLIPVFNIYRKNTIAKAAFYIWHASSTRRDFEDALMAAGLLEKQYITWAKNNIQMGRSDYQWDSEFCFYCEKDGETCNFYGDRAQHTVWRVTQCLDGAMMTVLGGGIVLTDGKGNKIFIADKAPKGKKVRYVRMEEGKSLDLYQEDRMDSVWKVDRETGYLHPTQKPVELAAIAIENSSQPGEIVLDFFGGSGSTLLAAEKTGRRCYTSELDPIYADVIVSRYVMATGNLGVKCIRGGQEYKYMDMVEQWAKDNGKEEELAGMKTPVVVVSKKAIKSMTEDDEDSADIERSDLHE